MMKQIFDSVKLGELPVKNRLVRSATWEGMAEEDGSIPEALYQTYEKLARGGTGTIITGFTSVSQDDRYFEGMMRLGKDELIPQYRRLTQILHENGAVAIAQLALGGYYEHGREYEPDALSHGQIQTMVGWFGDAARRAKAAQFDGVQIHAAHFFFLSRFISPAVNHRTDDYGGSTERRMRILREVLQDIHEKAPGLHVTMKLNASDFTHGGLEMEESLQIAEMMVAAGLDSIEVSGNSTSVAGIRAGVNEGYFYEYAKALAERIRIPVILVGGHRSIACMNALLNDSGIEFLSLSRPLVREPDLPNRWKRGDTTPARCVSCNACYRTPGHKCIFVLHGKK